MSEKTEKEVNKIIWKNINEISQETYSTLIGIEIEEISKALSVLNLENEVFQVNKLLLTNRLKELRRVRGFFTAYVEIKDLMIEKRLKSESFIELDLVTQTQ